MIEFKNVTIDFSGKTILRNINLQIKDRESLAIVGKSGSGKTVLIKCLLGLIHPFKGEVLINDQNIYKIKNRQLMEVRKKMAMLFQGAALFDSLNVYQNVAFPLFEHTDYKESVIREIVREKLSLVGLPDVESKMPSELSGGMRKRVGLARAITLNPQFMIYDEPTTGLDPIIGIEIINQIEQLQNSNQTTSIVITHDMECLKRIADRIIMIHNQTILFDGEKKTFFESADSEIRKFLLKDN